MTIAVTPSKLIHRANTGLLVNETALTVTTTGAAATNPFNRLVASDHLYHEFANNLAAWEWDVLNRTETNELYAKTLIKSTPTLSGVYQNPAATWGNFLRKRPGTETDNTYDGATFTEIVTSPRGIEIQPVSDVANPVTCGIGLSGLAVPAPGAFDWTAATGLVRCDLIFKNTGEGEIWESGVLVKQFTWPIETTVRGYIEIRGTLLRYWLIRSETDAILLRTRRLVDVVAPTRPIAYLYNTSATNYVRVLIFDGNEATENVQIYGVLNWNLQDWRNPQSLDSTGEKLFTKDKDDETTYYSKERNLISMGINLEWRYDDEYQVFREFAQYHDTSIPFIFMDQARAKLFLKDQANGLNDNEMFAKFISGFKDNPLGSFMYGASIDLRQVVNSPFLPASAY